MFTVFFWDYTLPSWNGLTPNREHRPEDMFNATAVARDRRVLRPVPTLPPHLNPAGTGVIGEQNMNALLADLRILSPAELLVVVFTPLSVLTLAAAFFFG